LQAGGDILLPTQWSLKPAGKQLKLGDFPVNIALHPREPWAAISHAGYGAHEIQIVDLKTEKLVSQVTVPQTFYGMCFDPAGGRLFASGAEDEVVHQFVFADGFLSEHRELRVADPKQKFVPAGLSCSPDGKMLYVANAWGHTLCLLPLAEPEKVQHLALEPDSYPYTSLPTPDGKRLYVSLWGRGAVAVLNLETRKFEAEWPTAAHPTELALSPDSELLYVACANSNTVSVFDTQAGKALEVISSALYPQAPNGSTPNSLALSPDGKALFIANADNNNVAAFNVSERGHSHSLGYIPVGWYPTSVRFSPLTQKIYVANGKGLTSKANRQGPNPKGELPRTVTEYIAGLFRGTLSTIEPPSPADMANYTKQAYACSPLLADIGARNATRTKENPIPAKVGDSSPIKHCIYIVKENRTYDQVFGDLPQGNGDPDLCISPRKSPPITTPSFANSCSWITSTSKAK
jgi:DNA-binding beta-propeller fold protein YncE